VSWTRPEVPSRRSWALGIAPLLSICAAAFLSTTDVNACGGFFTRRVLESERRPSLAYEQTLIIFDAEKRREHFVREVVFRTSREPFGFVVPTPSKPEVAKVAPSPFAKLRESFPFRPSMPNRTRSAKGGERRAGARSDQGR
jgi:hypothetical protein